MTCSPHIGTTWHLRAKWCLWAWSLDLDFLPVFICIRSEFMRQISHLSHLLHFSLHQGAIFLTGFPFSERKPGDGLQKHTSCTPTPNEHPAPATRTEAVWCKSPWHIKRSAPNSHLHGSAPASSQQHSLCAKRVSLSAKKRRKKEKLKLRNFFFHQKENKSCGKTAHKES